MHTVQVRSWNHMLQTSENYKNQPTNKTQKIFHDTNCKNEYAIYLMKYTIYNLQYVGKNETPFNIRLNNHQKDVKDPKAILADKHIQKSGHRFNEHSRFMSTDRFTKHKT